MFGYQRFRGSEIFERAKALSLNGFIKGVLGDSPKNRGRRLRYATCPNASCRAVVNCHSERLVVTDDRYFRCFRCGMNGTIIDAAMLVWGFDPLDAAKALLGESNVPTRPRIEVDARVIAEERRQTEAVAKALVAVLAAADAAAQDRKNLRFLCRERAIPQAVVREAQARRLLGFLPASRTRATTLLRSCVGDELLVAAGFWDRKFPDPWISRRPLIFFFPGMTAAEFRLNRAPRETEKKSLQKGVSAYPWFWRGQDPTRAIVVEGFIDLLSVAALGYPGHIVGLAGTYKWQPEWFIKLRDQGVALVERGFDDDRDSPDNPGQTASAVLAEYLDEIGLAHRNVTHPGGDMNDLLRARVPANRD
jgi:Toprim-like